jgi:hypothetical protein
MGFLAGHVAELVRVLAATGDDLLTSHEVSYEIIRPRKAMFPNLASTCYMLTAVSQAVRLDLNYFPGSMHGPCPP